MSHNTKSGSALFHPEKSALVIADMVITDTDVVTESRRWSTGRRGASIPAQEMGDADLGAFVSQALAVGARAIASAGSVQDTFDLERLVAEVGTRTVATTTEASEATTKAVAGAVEAVGKSADAVRKAFAESEVITRKNFAETVKLSTKELRDEVERLVGGDSPELLAKLGPILDAAGKKMGEQAFEQTDKLLTKVSRQFDPADPTSPFAKQAAALAEQQNALTASMDKNHLALVGKVDELAKAVAVDKAARAAAERTASVTPLKGATFESAIHSVMETIAVGLGDDYCETGSHAGTISRCKKGDGVLIVGAVQARVVIEMHDSSDRRAWSDYLDEAERNREAVASIGIVRDPSQNKGETIRVLGPRRMVLAFDPASDEADILRTVVQCVRTAAIASSSRRDIEGLETAEESIQAALELLDGINKVRKASGSVRQSANTIDKECNSIQTGISRHLGAALDALSGVTLEAAVAPASGPEASAGEHGAA